jgi:hypothetical protein
MKNAFGLFSLAVALVGVLLLTQTDHFMLGLVLAAIGAVLAIIYGMITTNTHGE